MMLFLNNFDDVSQAYMDPKLLYILNALSQDPKKNNYKRQKLSR